MQISSSVLNKFSMRNSLIEYMYFVLFKNISAFDTTLL